MMRPVLAASLAFGLSACSFSGEPAPRAAAAPASLEAVVGPPAAWASASGPAPTSGVVLLPAGAGDVTGVSERVFANGFAQTVALQGERSAKGANQVEIAVAAAKGSGSNQAPLWKPSEAGIKGEIRARFPGVAMQVIAQPRQNAYGPVGLAVGRQGETRCVYAWQWIDDVRESARGKPRWMSGGQAVPATLRVRLCRSGVTADELAAVVEGLTIDLNLRSETVPSLEAGVAQAPRPARAAKRQTASKDPPPEPVRRAPKPVAERSPDRDAGTAPSVAWGPDGRQYLAPVQSARAAPAAGAAQAVRAPGAYPGASSVPYANGGAAPQPAGSQKAKALDPSLPSQAYLGPTGPSGRAKTTGGQQDSTPAAARRDQP